MGPPQRPARTLRILASHAQVAELLRVRCREQGVALGLGLIDQRGFEDRLLGAFGIEPISTTEARFLIAVVGPEAARATPLASLASRPGFAESFLELWDTLRRAGLDHVNFARVADRLAQDRRAPKLSVRRFAALAKLAGAYERRLATLGLVDEVGARARLPGMLAGLGRTRLLALADGATRLWIEPNPELPVIRARLWEALARAGLEVAVEIPVLPSATAEFAGELGFSLELLRRNLVDEAPSVELVATPLLSGERSGPFAGVGLVPFASPSQAFALLGQRAEQLDQLELIELMDGEDQRAELRGVCARIRTLLHEGVAPQAIRVAVPGVGRGQARARVLAAFDEAGIAHDTTASRFEALVHAAPLRLTLALIDAAERELPREALADLLESAYITRPGAATLIAGLREAGSRDDRGLGHLARLQAHAAKLSRKGHADHRRRAARGREYEALARAWAPVFVQLRLAGEATVLEHVAALFSVLRLLGIPERCRSLPTLGQGFGERGLQRDAIAALARDRAALDLLEQTGQELARAAARIGVEAEAISLTQFRAQLEAALAGVHAQPVGIRGAGVGVCELGDLARSTSDHVFIVHAVEGELPGPSRGLALLDDDDRQLLERALGRAIAGSASGADAASFALACAGARSSLTISTHRQDADGREVVRSRYFDAVARALGSNQAVHELEAGVIPSLAQVSTRAQLLTRLGHAAGLGAEGSDLESALGWAATRSGDLGRARVELQPSARALAHARLGFDGSGPLTWRGSATSLEDYAACPFRLFAARVLRIRRSPAITDELDAAEQGSVRHEVLAEVMQALRREGLTPVEGGDRTGHENRVAQAVCEQVLDRWQQRERTGPAPLWLLHRDLIARDLGRVLEGERRAGIEAWEPGEFELGFGVLAADGSGVEGEPLTIPDPRGERRFELIGRVDRIDYRGHGREREGLIIDYKSGRVGDRLRGDQLARTQLQLPLYAAWLAARMPELRDTDAAYVSLRDGDRSKVSLLDACLSNVDLDGLLELDVGAREQLRARPGLDGSTPGRSTPPAAAVGALDLARVGQRNLADNVWALLGGVAVGRFDVRPEDPSRACRFCPYGPVCRVERGDEIEADGDQGAP